MGLPESVMTRHTSVMYGATYLSKDPIFRRNRISEVVSISIAEKEEIFSLVYKFIGHLITDSSFLNDTLRALHYDKDSSNISITKISNKMPISSQSSKSVTESEPSDNACKESGNKLSVKKDQKRAKISIMVQGSLSEFGSSSWISSQSLLNLSSLKLPHNVLTQELTEKIFE